MNRSQVLGLLGAALVIAGVFSPILTLPVIGDITLSDSGYRTGLAMLAASGAVVILVVARQAKWSWLPGIAVVVLLIAKFFRIQSNMSETLDRIQSQGTDSLHVGRAFSDSVHYQWGWALLAVGAILMIVGGATYSDPIDRD